MSAYDLLNMNSSSEYDDKFQRFYFKAMEDIYFKDELKFIEYSQELQ